MNLKAYDVINCLEKEKRYNNETLPIDRVLNTEHFYGKIMLKMCTKRQSLQGLFQKDKASLKVSFLIKFFFLSLNNMCQKHILIREIQPPLALLDCPSALQSNKGAPLQQRRALYQEYFDSVLSFLINKVVYIKKRYKLIFLKYFSF